MIRSKSEFSARTSLCASLTLAALAWALPSANAATFVVNNFAEYVAAINASNSNGESDIIEIPAGVTISMTNQPPAFTADGAFTVTVRGAGKDESIISGGEFLPLELGGTGGQTWTTMTLLGGNFTIEDLTIRWGRAPETGPFDSGGGNIITANNAVVTINRCRISEGVAVHFGDGIAIAGGILNANDTLQFNLLQSEIVGNLALSTGTNQEAWGGGMLLASPNALVDQCTFSGNRAEASGTASAKGGAIYHVLSIASIRRSTISGNSAVNGTPLGGGIYSDAFTNLESSTVSNNIASNGGGLHHTGTDFYLSNTIVAGNTAGTGPEVSGTFNSGGHNLIRQGTGGTITGATASDQIGTAGTPINALLGPLQNNGGPTQTIALLAGSPAIDAGTNAFLSGTFSEDQRGFVRLLGTQSDKGALELDDIPPQLTTFTVDDNTSVETVSGTFSVVDANAIDPSAFRLYARPDAMFANWFQVSGATFDDVAGTWSAPLTSDGSFFLTMIAADGSGNSITTPTGTGNFPPQATTLHNGVANSTLFRAINGTGPWVFPMESDLDIVVTLTGPVTAGNLTVSRTEGDVAPTADNPANFIDQSVTITPGGGLAFTSASVTFGYDEALLGGIAEGDITEVWRDNSGTTTQFSPTSVNTTLNTITVDGITEFSDWYFGNDAANLEAWMILGQD